MANSRTAQEAILTARENLTNWKKDFYTNWYRPEFNAALNLMAYSLERSRKAGAIEQPMQPQQENDYAENSNLQPVQPAANSPMVRPTGGQPSANLPEPGAVQPY